MKIVKMSLVVSLLLGVNIYAIENVKVNGDVKVFYGSQDESAKGTPKDDIFDKDASYADTALHLGLTADLSEGVSTGISTTFVSSLGLENNLVSNVWSGAHDASTGSSGNNGTQVDDAMWIDELWIAGTAFDTTAKLGRQALDTPLAFTETWGIDTNTFEAVVLLNQSIADTTLVATYIGKSNGSASDLSSSGLGLAGYVSKGGKFNSFYNGVYALGGINNSWKPLTLQAWYYDLQTVAKAYWLQADLNMEGILVGAQYANVNADAIGAATDKGYSAMLGYEMKDLGTLKVAYSSIDDEGTLGLANTATGGGNTAAQSKLYTEMWWNYGTVATTGTDTLAITIEATVGPEIDLFAGYYTADIDPKGLTTGSLNGVDEVALTASKSFGPLDTTLALIYDEYTYEDATAVGKTQDLTTLQVYLTYNF